MGKVSVTVVLSVAAALGISPVLLPCVQAAEGKNAAEAPLAGNENAVDPEKDKAAENTEAVSDNGSADSAENADSEAGVGGDENGAGDGESGSESGAVEVPAVPQKIDSDNDGIADEVEEKFGLNINDASDALQDTDGDGYSNIFEIEKFCSPADPKHRPPLWWRLALKEIRMAEFPLMLESVTVPVADDRSSWVVKISYPDFYRPGKRAADELMIGSVFTVANRRYRLEDVKKSGADNSGEWVAAVRELTAAGPGEEVIELELGKSVSANELCAVLIDTGHPALRECVVRVRDVVVLGLFAVESDNEDIALPVDERRWQLRKYQVCGIDKEKMCVQLWQLPVKGKKDPVLEVTVQGKVPENRRPVHKEKTEKVNELLENMEQK